MKEGDNPKYVYRVFHQDKAYYIKAPMGKKKVFAYEDKELKVPAKYRNGGRIMFRPKNLLRVK